MKKLKRPSIQVCVILMAIAFSSQAFARGKNNNPSSGRRLAPNHWLTCWGGVDFDFVTNRDYWIDGQIPDRFTEMDKLKAHELPHKKGSYRFEVRDTWEEWVTHSGTSCSHCGETCVTTGHDSQGNDTESCSCNSCSWQELETFYRPWSSQNIHWEVRWKSSPEYLSKRQKWIDSGSPDVVRDASHLDLLLEHDPDRPFETYLFPGEVERIKISSSVGSSFDTSVDIVDAYHDYDVYTSGGDGLCDDRDYKVTAVVESKGRKKTVTPNSLEFQPNWISGETDSSGAITGEPGMLNVVDLAASLYDGQNILDHFKNNLVRLWVREINRAWWFDRRISGLLELDDMNSKLVFPENDLNQAPVGHYEIQGSELLQTTGWAFFSKNRIHLKPGKTYEVCGSIWRKNNIYYKQKKYIFFDGWSEKKCSRFTYSENSEDKRGGGRKFRDSLTKVTTLPWW